MTSRVQSVMLCHVGHMCDILSAVCRDVSCRDTGVTTRVQSVVMCRIGSICDITSAVCRVVSSRSHV